MNSKYRLLLALLPLLTVAAPAEDLPAPVDFNREIRPILSDKCFSCHGPDKKHRKGKLRLDLEESARDPQKGGIQKAGYWAPCRNTEKLMNKTIREDILTDSRS